MTSKSELRRIHLLRRRTLASARRQAWDAAIRKCVLGLPEIVDAPHVLAHVAVSPEVDSIGIINALLGEHKLVSAPIMSEVDDYMRWGAVTSLDALVQGPYGILQPSADRIASVPQNVPIVVPCVAFDERCVRLGRGGGHFDRFLETHRGAKIGIAYECQRADAIPVEPHDVPLDAVVTEAQVYRRG